MLNRQAAARWRFIGAIGDLCIFEQGDAQLPGEDAPGAECVQQSQP